MQENIDTTSSGGKLIFHIFASFAEFERDKDPERSVKEICEIVGISRNTYYKYTRSEEKSAANRNPEKASRPAEKKWNSPETEDSPPVPRATSPQPRVMKVKMWLRVENNNKFVRGKKKAREEIERHVLSRFAMEKPHKDSWEYTLTIPFTTEEELDRIIYEEISREAEMTADLRHCFTEADITSLDAPERSW